MATTLTAYQDKQWLSDFIKWEQDQRISRQVVTVGVSQTLTKGQVVADSGAGIDDVQVFTLTCTTTTDAGSVKFQYGDAWDKRSDAVAFGASLSAANVQTALRALGVVVGDVALAACTVALSVASAGANGAVYTVTCKTQYVPPLQVVENTLVTGTTAATLGTGTTSNVGVHTVGASPNNIVVLPAAMSQVVTFTAGTSPAAGTFQLQIGSAVTTALNYNDSISTIQTAVDTAVGANQIVVSGDGLAGTSKTLVLTLSGPKYYGLPQVNCHYVILTAHTTMAPLYPTKSQTGGAQPVGIMAVDVTTSASVPRQALLISRQAIVDADLVTFGANVTAIADKAKVLAALEASRLLVARREPGTSTTQST